MSDVTITLDRERGLRLDFNALALCEKVTGRSALQASTWAGVRAMDLSALLWAAHVAHAQAPYLLSSRPVPEDLDVLTVDQVRAHLDHTRLQEATELLECMWETFFPKTGEPSGEGGSPEGPTRS